MGCDGDEWMDRRCVVLCIIWSLSGFVSFVMYVLLLPPDTAAYYQNILIYGYHYFFDFVKTIAVPVAIPSASSDPGPFIGLGKTGPAKAADVAPPLMTCHWRFVNLVEVPERVHNVLLFLDVDHFKTLVRTL